MKNPFLPLSAIVLVAAVGYLSSSSERTEVPTSRMAGLASGNAQPITLGPLEPTPKHPPIEWVESGTYTADGPYPVELADVPSGVYDPFNKLARDWGISGPKRITRRITPEEADRLRAEALLLPPARGLLVPEPSNPAAPVEVFGFPSLDINDCCGEGASVPPDPELAVGPDHIIAVVNTAFAVYDKSGTLLAGPITFSSFFQGTPNCSNTAVFDPNVLYDEEADRFILGIDGNGTDYCVAATVGPDPLGSWNTYGFATNFAGAFFDFPHAGVGVDAIYLGSNQFGGTLPGGFEGRVFAMDKTALYSGAGLTVATHSTGSDGTPQPMNLHGFAQGTWPASGPHYVMTEVFDGATHTLWSWQDPFGADTLVRAADFNLNTATGITAGFPIDVPQLGSLQKIQAGDWRGLDTEYRNGFIWMTNSISCNPGTGTVNCVRWAKIDPTALAVVDAGVVASNGKHRIFPDLAVNQCEDVAIGYTKSASDQYPSVYATGFESGLLQAELALKEGELTYTAFDSSPRRWGDYSGMTIDPDGERFWYLGEYSKNTGNTSGRWGTYIGSFRYDGCTAPASPIGASATGITVRRVFCTNSTTGQTVSVQNAGTSWDCRAAGLNASPNDKIRQLIIGIASGGATNIGGTFQGLNARYVNCSNQTTRESVSTPTGVPQWSCTDLGLSASTGNVIRETVLGIVP